MMTEDIFGIHYQRFSRPIYPNNYHVSCFPGKRFSSIGMTLLKTLA